MSFVRTLGLLAVGFAAARGVTKVREMGGMDAMRQAMRNAGAEGGVADQMGQMAEKMGLPGGQEKIRRMMTQFGNSAADASEATEAGLGNLMGAMSSAAAAGSKGLDEMIGSLTGGTALGQASEENARLMIRAMIQAAKADGEIDPDERKKILDHLSDASDEEIAFVEAALDAPVDAAALAADAGGTARAQVYSAALMAIRVDTDAERQFLQGLAQALGLGAETVAQIHTAMGRPQL